MNLEMVSRLYVFARRLFYNMNFVEKDAVGSGSAEAE